MRTSIVILLLVLGLTAVSTKRNGKTQIEMQVLDQESQISKNIHLSQSEIHSSSPKPYSQERFSSRKKIHSGTNDPTLMAQASLQGKQTRRVETRGDSILGDMIIGSLLFFSGFPCLWFNEKGYAYTKTFLRKYIKICKNVESAEIDPNNEDKLLCVQGDSVTSDEIVDSTFDMKVTDSIRLHRMCQMYQWVEHRKTRRINNDLDEVYYTYTLEWMNSFVESMNYTDAYGHENNNGDWLYNEEELFANNVTYGAFKLTESQKKQCKKVENIPFTIDILDFVASKNNYQIANNPIPQSDQNQSAQNTQSVSAPPPANPMLDQQPPQGYQPTPSYDNIGHKTLIVRDGFLYFKRDLSRNNPGDFRVKFSKTPCGPISVVGKQSFGCIETFCPEENQKKRDDDNEDLSTEGCCACCSVICKFCEAINAPISEINWVMEEKCKKKKVFQKQLSDYEFKTWMFRLLGFCCFWFGVYFMLSPVYTLLYWFPLVGGFLGALGSFICGLVGFLIAIPLSILTISIAWLFYRKEIGIPLLCVALILIGYFSYSYANDYKGQQNQEVKTYF